MEIENQPAPHETRSGSRPSTSMHTPTNIIHQHQDLLLGEGQWDDPQSPQRDVNSSVGYEAAFASDVVSFFSHLRSLRPFIWTMMPTWLERWIVGFIRRWYLAWRYLMERTGTTSDDHTANGAQERASFQPSLGASYAPSLRPDIADTPLEDSASRWSAADDGPRVVSRGRHRLSNSAGISTYSNGMYTYLV